MDSKLKRVVVTGMGVVSPLGCNVNQLYKNTIDGKSNFSKPTNYSYNYNGELKNVSYVSTDFEKECECNKLTSERSIHNYVMNACLQAIKQANITKIDLQKANLYIGSSENYEFDNLEYFNQSENECEEFLKARKPINRLYNLASSLGIYGESVLLPIACSGGNVAISLGSKKIKYGMSDICLVGGVDNLVEKTYITFHSLSALSSNKCKPFCKDRDGITPSEGAGFFVLESLEHAQKRGATILAEITGYDESCDAYHLTTPDISAIMATISIKNALKMSKISPFDVDYIIPHGTGTYSNDIQEAVAIKNVFNEYGEQLPICALKSILGHCMAASSSIETIIAIMSILKNDIPKPINITEIDDTFPTKLNLTKFNIEKEVTTILKNSFAFGGNICTIIISKYI